MPMVKPMKSKKVKAIRLTDPYIVKLITQEQNRSGESTATKTAARLIAERLTLKEAGQREPVPA